MVRNYVKSEAKLMDATFKSMQDTNDFSIIFDTSERLYW